MPSIEALMHTNLLEVFGERDAEKRREVIARTYTDDVEFLDPEDTITGHDALHAKAGSILDGAPGLVFSPAADVRVLGDLGLLPWHLGPEGADPVVTGTDIAIIRDGLIARVYTLVDH